jgi:hypothetical protein
LLNSNIIGSIQGYVKEFKTNFKYTIEGYKRWFDYRRLVIHDFYDFDYSSILLAEQYQIKRVRDSIIKYQTHVSWERDVEKMNLALSLLDIILDNVDILEIGEGPWKKGKWKLLKYVNTRNLYRFTDFDVPKLPEITAKNLYYEKAWHLYFELRKEFTRNWWD